MDRRSFMGSCTAGAACLSASSFQAIAANAQPRAYSRVLLVDERGDPLRASKLRVQANYVFHYPFEATPVFLLDLGKTASPHSLSTKDRSAYSWPGGVGRMKSVVAYSAICAHQLVYPTKDVSFISFRKTRAQRGVQDELIHCCADHSQYDPARGAEVLSGPAPQPLAAVLLEHDAKADTLTAWGTLGGEMFDEFFRRYAAKLSLDVGPQANRAVSQKAVVRELEKFCRNSVQC
ncbi:(2Fe-2S)-binding protein [Ramlibacter sp.]|uniref:(2Fe-2S)-binding protein n=1 Tax=Ramlibacter sp. TaxID=1917967 RepID=UPI003D0F82B2